MIYIILGTKAQFIKMFPVMKCLDQLGVKYKFVHTGQHYGVNLKNMKRLGIEKPDVYLTRKKKDLANLKELLFWVPKVFWEARKLKMKPGDYVVIHGDTESSVLGAMIALFFRAKIVHVEAGLRSGDLLNPFPEEINRRIVSLFANICFCPTKKDAQNIKGKKQIYVTDGNTLFDASALALKIKPSNRIKPYLKEKYVLFLFHRKENLFTKSNIETVMDILELILKRGYKVIWVFHANTKYELTQKKLWPKVRRLSVKYNLVLEKQLLDYVDFLHLLKNSLFVASDGGSVQEEAYRINKPMLMLRKKTERDWGLGENVCFSVLNQEKVKFFLSHLSEFKRAKFKPTTPSLNIAKVLASLKK